MKKTLLFLLLLTSMLSFGQDIFSVSKPLKLATVTEGSKNDSVLVRGSDKIVKFVPRSQFGGNTEIPTIQQVLDKGNTSNKGILINTTEDEGISATGTFVGVRGYGEVGLEATGSVTGINVYSPGRGVYTQSSQEGLVSISSNAQSAIFSITSPNTSNIADFTKDGIPQLSISHDGKITGNSFIKTGSNEDEYLMGNGSVKNIDNQKQLNLSSYNLESNFFDNKNIENNLDISTRKNIMVNSETYTSGNFVVASTGMTIDNTDIFVYKGIKLSRFKGNSYNSSCTIRQSNLVPGKRYMVSYYIKQMSKENNFIWDNGSNTTSSAHSARYIDSNVRRVHFIYQANAVNSVFSNLVPTTPIGTGTTGFITFGVTKNTTNFTDAYIGGFQIEEIEGSYVDGVAWIGDSTIQTDSGNINRFNTTSIPRYFEGLMNCVSYNQAVAGERLDQMDARWATSMTPLKPNSKYCVIQGGINDIIQGRTLSEMQVSVTSMNTKALADGFIPVFLTCSPNGNNTILQNQQRTDFNAWLKSTFKRVIDINSVVEGLPNRLLEGTPKIAFESDLLHYGIKFRKDVAVQIARSGFFEFLQPSDYQKTTTTYTGKDLSVKSATVADLTFSSSPSTSASGYDLATINSATNKLEKIPNTFVSSASPAFSGVPTAPTAPVGTNTTQIATTAFVMTENSGNVKTTGNQLITGQKTFNDILGGQSTSIQAVKRNTNGTLVDLQVGSNDAGGTMLNVSSAPNVTSTNTVKLLNLNAGLLATGMPLTVQNNGVDTFTVDKFGNITANNLVFKGTYSSTATGTTVFTVPIGRTMSNTDYVANPVPRNTLSTVMFSVQNKTATSFDIVVLTGLTGTVSFDFTVTP